MKIWLPSTWFSISVPDPPGQCASLSPDPDRKAQSAEPQVWPKPRFKKERKNKTKQKKKHKYSSWHDLMHAHVSRCREDAPDVLVCRHKEPL